MADKTELTDSLVYGVDLKNRRIYFGTPVDSNDDSHEAFSPASVEVAIRAMHKMVSDAPGKPIELHMASYGGDPCAMLRLYDEILSCPCQVKFYGGGFIMSAATWIMVVCDERHLQPHTTVMVHDGWAMPGDQKHTDLQVWAKEDKRLQDLLYDIYAANTRMPREFWADVCQRDLYLTASEAVSLGMADKLVEPKKRGNLRKVRQASMKKVPDAAEMQRVVDQAYARISKVSAPRINLNPLVKELADPNVIIDERPVEIEKAPEPSAQEPSKDPIKT